jgi:hypothetical protein
VAGALAAGALGGCDEPRRQAAPRIEEPARQVAPAELPEAMLVRYEIASGSGLAREGWELEVLQMGSDIRVRGTVRRPSSAVPIFRPMGEVEFAEFWYGIRQFPLDGYRVRTDPSAPEPGWRTRLKFDAVVGVDRRLLCDNEWTRPPLDAPWVQQIEERLHGMVAELAEREVAEADTAGSAQAARDAVQRALEAIGEARRARGKSPAAAGLPLSGPAPADTMRQARLRPH